MMYPLLKIIAGSGQLMAAFIIAPTIILTIWVIMIAHGACPLPKEPALPME